MSVKLNVNYGQPTDPDHFVEYFTTTHAPIAMKIPGLRSMEFGKGLPNLDGSANEVFWVATLGFDSMDEVNAAFASEEGQAAAADMANYASGGATMTLVEATKTM